jgi:tricorn protease-like protein
MIAILKSWLAGNRTAHLNIRGNQSITAMNYTAPGDDAQPLPGDPVLLISLSDRGSNIIVATADTQNAPVAQPGEKRLYSRKIDGTAAVQVWLKRTGEIVISNSAGSITMSAAGLVNINGVTVDEDGNLRVPGTVIAGPVGSAVGLTTHVHSTSGGPSGPPVEPTP